MDRERLKEVHQTDLTESKVNEDFVEWLKTKGPSWLLMVLVVLCAYLFIVKFRQGKNTHRQEAWAALVAADLPGSYEDVAKNYADVGHVATVARLQAADTLMHAVQSGLRLGATLPRPAQPGTLPPPPVPADLLEPGQRLDLLKRADALYAAVADEDTGNLDTALYTIVALNGRAAVAESLGDAAAAKSRYEEAAARAEADFPGLATQARTRAESAGRFAVTVTLPTETELRSVRPPPFVLQPVRIDPGLRDLIMPDAPEEPGG